MRKPLLLALFLVCLQPATKAQVTLVPAGTLLHCTIDDPTISPKTAEVGDPVLCHLNQFTEFGHPVFPRGSYLAGHLEAAKQPGHFIQGISRHRFRSHRHAQCRWRPKRENRGCARPARG